MRRLVHRLGGAHDRVDLHLVDLGIQDPEPAAAGAEHRVALVDFLDPRQQHLELLEVVVLLEARALDLRAQLGQVGQELVQRRVEQPDRHRQALHRLEDALEVLLLKRQQLASAARRPSPSSAMIIARIFGWRSSAMNMCSVRHRPIPSAPSSRARIASLGVSALARTPRRRSSSAHSSTVSKRSSSSGSISFAPSLDDLAVAAVDADLVALVKHPAVDPQLTGLDVDREIARR